MSAWLLIYTCNDNLHNIITSFIYRRYHLSTCSKVPPVFKDHFFDCISKISKSCLHPKFERAVALNCYYLPPSTLDAFSATASVVDAVSGWLACASSGISTFCQSSPSSTINAMTVLTGISLEPSGYCNIAKQEILSHQRFVEWYLASKWIKIF